MAADGYSSALLPQHAEMLAASGITPEHASARGYQSVDERTWFDRSGLNVTRAGRRVPGLLVPQLRADGSTWGYQYRPDSPRERDGKPVKYETPTGQRNGIDVPPGVAEHLGDPSVPLWVTEGVKKADAGALAGLCIVALPGVWSWRGGNAQGGKVAVPDWHDIALNDRRVVLAFDGDVARKKAVRAALDALAAYLSSKGANVEFCHLPDEDDKVGLDDYLVAGGTVEQLRALVRPSPPAIVQRATKGDGGDRGDALTSSVAHVADVALSQGTGERPESGADLLGAVEVFVRRFCVLPNEAAYVAVTLWAAHTHFIRHLDTTGRLACLSPEPGSGKTRVLEVLDVICANPLLALDLSMSAFFRIVSEKQPTILLDEVDAIFTGKSKAEGTEDLRRVINNGYRTGAVVQRVGGQNRDEVQEFRVFTPVAMAGLGNLPDTLMSRSVILRMRRRARHEVVEPWRDRIHRPEGGELQARLTTWSRAIGALTYPTLPEGVEDRDADVWEPLLMVADVAGGTWPERARAACVEFVRDKPIASVSLGVRLLADLRSIWPEHESVMSTSDIIEQLATLDEAPWADLYGEGLRPRKLAQMLSDYGAASTDVRTPLGTRKGYRREDLWDAWQRYVPDLPVHGSEDTPHPYMSDRDDRAIPARSPQKGDKGDIRDTAGQSVAEWATPAAVSATQRATTEAEPRSLPAFTPPTDLPGRCRSCGFHIEKQGHSDACPERSAS